MPRRPSKSGRARGPPRVQPSSNPFSVVPGGNSSSSSASAANSGGLKSGKRTGTSSMKARRPVHCATPDARGRAAAFVPATLSIPSRRSGHDRVRTGNMNDATIRLHVEKLADGGCLATSADVPTLGGGGAQRHRSCRNRPGPRPEDCRVVHRASRPCAVRTEPSPGARNPGQAAGARQRAVAAACGQTPTASVTRPGRRRSQPPGAAATAR